MKNIFRKINGLFLLILMLFSVAFFDVSENLREKEHVGAGYSSSNYVLETSASYVNDLISQTGNIESQYNLADKYPLVSENQKDTPFCWIYSSMKSLESALMVQRDEFYNFSETGLAYLYYLDRIDSEGTSVGFYKDGNFETFLRCYQDYGLILESDFSNTECDEIDSDNYSDYSFVENFASKELNSTIKPYLLGTNSAFSSLATYDAKITVLKKFVRTYGAVFAGIEGSSDNNKGCIYSDNTIDSMGIYKFYDVDRSSHVNKESYQPLNENHAICVVGWNDDIVIDSETGAFVVMNSWGFEENSVNFFYVPYSYTKMLSTVRGFICESEETISIESASDSSFANEIMLSTEELNNFFCYDDEIWVNYNLNLSSFENLDVKISSGNRSFNENFSITTNSETKTVLIKLNDNITEYYGGYYTISFYDDETLVGKRGIYIYSGTEIGYFKASNGETLNTYALDNAFLNANNVITINAPSIMTAGGLASAYFEFYRSPIANSTFLSVSGKDIDYQAFSMDISDVEIISSNNKSLETKYTQSELISGLFGKYSNDPLGYYFFRVGSTSSSGLNLSKFNNCLIKFKISINSSVYANCEREYVFNIFVSDRYSAKTADLYSVMYNLNGGINNEGNITKYPRYNPEIEGETNYDTNMTEFELLEPTKLGFEFLGWFLDEDCIYQVEKLDSSLQGNVTLYAKWENKNEDYFDVSLSLKSVINYDKSSKSLSDALVYGDSITLQFDFTKKSLIEDKNYTVHYYFYGTELIDDYLNKTDTGKTFDLNFPDLESGEHVFKIRVKVVINGLLEIEEEANLPVSVAKKNVVFGFTNLEKVYNGKIQQPDVDMVEDFYAEDFEGKSRTDLFNLSCGETSKDAGIYNFYVSEMINKNYSFDSESSTSKCVFEIKKRGISLVWKEYYHVYDGKNHFPEYEVVNIVPGDKVEFELNLSECKNAGTYIANVLTNTISNDNYTISEVSDFEFEILKATIRVIMHNTTDRIQTKSDKRKTPSYTIIGNYLSDDDLQIIIVTEARLATKSGTYTISCSIGNSSYQTEVEKATYTLTGYYNVYYQLSNGKTYTERVNEGDEPIGVTKEQLGVPYFSKISYSDDFVVTGDDIYVEVDYKDYSFVAYSGIIAVIGAIVAFVIYLKKRGNNVR